MLSVLDGHLTGPAGAEDRGGALWAPWVSSLATTPALSKGLFTHGTGASLPAEVIQGNKLLLCWQAQNPPVRIYILWVPDQLSFRVGWRRNGTKKKQKKTTKTTGALLNNIAYSNCSRNLAYWQTIFCFGLKLNLTNNCSRNISKILILYTVTLQMTRSPVIVLQLLPMKHTYPKVVSDLCNTLKCDVQVCWYCFSIFIIKH